MATACFPTVCARGCMVRSKLNKSMSVQGRSGLGSCTKVGSLYGFIRNDHMEPPPMWTKWLTDRSNWKHYFQTTSLASYRLQMKLWEGNVFMRVCTQVPHRDRAPPLEPQKRAVRILLECFLVILIFFLSIHDVIRLCWNAKHLAPPNTHCLEMLMPPFYRLCNKCVLNHTLRSCNIWTKGTLRLHNMIKLDILRVECEICYYRILQVSPSEYFFRPVSCSWNRRFHSFISY